MRRHYTRWVIGLILSLSFLATLLSGSALAAGKPKVYVIPIDGWQQIDPGLVQYAKRIVDAAEADPDAAAVAVILDTPGGLVDSALAMNNLLLSTDLLTVAFVSGNAYSAGALIGTAAEKLYMRPGSAIGAAEPRMMGTNEPADYKALSALAGTFESTAIARGRDPVLARAMVDKSFPAPGQRGDLLTLTYKEAVDLGYADGEAVSLREAITKAGIEDYELVETPMTFSEQAGRFLTQPLVAILLLVAGIIGLGIEFMKPGVTVPGLIGVVCLGLFFLGNALMGTANWVEIALAIIGLLLLVAEFFIPGFGVFGIGGVIAMAASIFLSVPTPELAWRYLMWATLAFVVVIIGLARTISRRGLGRILTLSDSGKGWQSARAELADLVGREGTTLTVLRPAGTALIGDQRVDVVTEGEFVPAGKPIQVVHVEGTRVVVRVKE